MLSKDKKASRLTFSFYLSITALIFLASSSTPLFSKSAPSYLLVNEDFQVVAMNGQPISEKERPFKTKLRLKAGLNKIAFIYKKHWKNKQGVPVKLIKSSVFIVEFTSIDSLGYHLSYLKPSNSVASETYANEPNLQIIDQFKQPVQSTRYYPNDQSMQTIIDAMQTGLRLKPHQPTINLSRQSKNKRQNIDKELVKLWKQASPKQQADFLQYIKTQKHD